MRFVAILTGIIMVLALSACIGPDDEEYRDQFDEVDERGFYSVCDEHDNRIYFGELTEYSPAPIAVVQNDCEYND